MPRTLAFIDASNLFYGGKKSLGWEIDYQKFLQYLRVKYEIENAFYLMKEKENFDRVVVLSGDGDFPPVLKYLRNVGKEVIVFARGPRTAREIRRFAGSNFRDFVRLEKYIRFRRKSR